MGPNKANLRLWVAALRTTDLKQGHGYLLTRNPEGVEAACCLEVANQVAAANGVPVPASSWVDLFTEREAKEYNDNNAGITLMTRVAWNWLELSSTGVFAGNAYIGEDTADGGLITASSANDELLWSFEQIADSIEKFYGLLGDDGDAE